MVKHSIHILGSGGFIGKSILRNHPKTSFCLWSHQDNQKSEYFDLNNEDSWEKLINQKPKIVILLSWPGLPNYNDAFHLKKNLPSCINLVEKLIENGLEKLTITGTCYEYGMANGSMKEDLITSPVNQYGLAKDTLRKSLLQFCLTKSVKLCWLRIFYPYGPNQNENALIPSLLRSIKLEEPFKISSGRQIRDFIHVDDVAKYIIKLTTNQKANGTFNIGSGRPLSIYEFIENRIKEEKSNIKIIRNYYPNRVDEPLAFWADMTKTNNIIGTEIN